MSFQLVLTSSGVKFVHELTGGEAAELQKNSLGWLVREEHGRFFLELSTSQLKAIAPNGWKPGKIVWKDM